jgi:MSHA pilin protein MshD
MSIKLRRQRGVTMIELVLFLVIVGVALAGIVAVMNFTTQRSADPVRRKQALMLAEALLEEVELAKFSYCDIADPRAGDDSRPNPVQSTAACSSGATQEKWGPEADNTRPYDNVNDYVSAPNTALQSFSAGGTLNDANGNPLPVSGFTVTLKIRPDAIGDRAGTAANTVGSLANATTTTVAADTELLRITVTVDYDGQSLSLDGYRARYAPNSL